MSLLTQTFDHTGSPTLTKGMTLGASGVSAPTLRIVGTIAAAGSANGQFNDQLGRGQFDYDSDGNLWICNLTNNAFEKWVRNVVTNQYEFHSRYTTLDALGSSVACDLIAVDRSRDQIHIASSAQTATGTAVGVWARTASGPYTVANRVRSYGTFSGSNGSGNARVPFGLTLSGDFAYVVSSAGDLRILKWNHTTGALVAEATRATLGNARFAGSEAAMYGGGQVGVDLGLRQMNVSTLAASARLDNNWVSGFRYTRRSVLNLGAGADLCDLAVFDGFVYVRMREGGLVQAWKVADNSFADEYLWPGGNGTSGENYGHAPGQMFTNAIQFAKIGFCAHPTLSDDFLAWSGNAQTATQSQCFLNAYPVSTATATWTKSDWSESTNTLKALNIIGANLGAEKYKIRLRKNSEAWITFTSEDLDDAAFFASVGTFTAGDVLAVELSLSTWHALDFGALAACRNKLAPSNVRIRLEWDDPSDAIIVHQQTSALQGALAGGGLLGRLSA